MNIRILFSRATAFFVTYVFLLGVPFFFAYRMHPVLYPIYGKNWWLAPVGLMTFFATLAPLAYDQIRRSFEWKFLAEQKRYQKFLLQLASGLFREHGLNRLSKLIVYSIKRLLKLDFAAIFIDDNREGYRLQASRGASIFTPNFVYPYQHDILLFSRSGHGYSSLSSKALDELPGSIKKFLPGNTGLFMPITIDGKLLGFIIISKKKNKELYSEDDINVFKILMNQAALAFENALFYKIFTEKITPSETVLNQVIELRDKLKQVTDPVAIVEKLCTHFHLVVNRLKTRYDNRPALTINDEYDIQDVLHALLKLFFEDIRAEEYTPSYAGASARIDFLLLDETIGIETKRIHEGLSVKILGEQLIVDIEKYKQHPKCKTLFCFVYDPDGKIPNPRGFEKDLMSRSDQNLKVNVLIAPRGY